MSITRAIKNWLKDTAQYKAGELYQQGSCSIYKLLAKVLAKVELADEHIEKMRKLGENGLLIYAIKHKSQLDSLILKSLADRHNFPAPIYCHGINMIFWQPFSVAYKVIISALVRRSVNKKHRQEGRLGHLERLITERKTAIIHLGSSEFFENTFVTKTLTRLAKAQTSGEEPIYLVPVLVTYSRRRLLEEEGIFTILFGQEEHMGPLRRILTFLRFAGKTSVIMAEPIKLADYLAENHTIPLEEAALNLRGELIDRIDEEKTSIVGPVLKSREEIINITLGDERLQETIARLAAKEKKSPESLRQTARKHLQAIAADYNEGLIQVWARFLTWLWNNIYDGLVIDREGLAGIRTLSKRMPFVIIPCHRSHIDYLVLSYVFYKQKIQMPFVAAGDNLSFWPIGYIFRKSGAFFLRRTFKGSDIYGDVFAQYLKTLLKEGLPLEFFIEGGRSRTGKMVLPKYGLLSMIIQAYHEKACNDLALIPVYIGYDKVVEEKAYLNELTGTEKEREKTTDVIKSSKILRKRFGSVYVNVGKPILLKSYLAEQEKTLTEMSITERQSFYRKIGYEIVLAINKVSLVTPFSLVAAGLLSHDRRGITHEDLMQVLDGYYEYLTHRNVKFASTFSNRQRALYDALTLFDQSGAISRIGADDEDEEIEEIVYSLEEEKRLGLEYYKNNILHFFLPLSFVAASILSSRADLIPLSQIIDDYQFFKRLFRHEFIFDDRMDDLDEVNDVLAYLNKREMVFAKERLQRAWIEVTGAGRAHLRPFSGLIHNYIESYWVVVRGCTYLRKKAKSEKEFIKKLHHLGTKIYHKGEIMRTEALSQANYANALRFVREDEVVQFGDIFIKGKQSKTPLYTLADAKRLESLRRQLFRFL